MQLMVMISNLEIAFRNLVKLKFTLLDKHVPKIKCLRLELKIGMHGNVRVLI